MTAQKVRSSLCFCLNKLTFLIQLFSAAQDESTRDSHLLHLTLVLQHRKLRLPRLASALRHAKLRRSVARSVPPQLLPRRMKN
jgi:hypothetical protein